jgi:hypothetical protein
MFSAVNTAWRWVVEYEVHTYEFIRLRIISASACIGLHRVPGKRMAVGEDLIDGVYLPLASPR